MPPLYTNSAPTHRQGATTGNLRHAARRGNRHSGFYSIRGIQGRPRIIRLLIAFFLLLPLLAIIVYALGLSVVHSNTAVERIRFWMRTPIWYTLLGALVYTVLTLMHIKRVVFTYIYVLGHELTHAIAILLCGGKISEFRVTATQGGHVTSNKSNIFISLSPYFVPLWMIVWMLLVWSINLINPFSTYEEWFYAGFGFWWAFHLFWTPYEIIIVKQPDIFNNGLVFSLLIILCINFLLISGFLMLFDIFSTATYWNCLVYSTKSILGLIF
ncbi:MAG: hypothetical protein E7033_08260 [Akkermansiaceae bacterium]|nr:hypothetical protein [Akkermansiaceae bacterium]